MRVKKMEAQWRAQANLAAATPVSSGSELKEMKWMLNVGYSFLLIYRDQLSHTRAASVTGAVPCFYAPRNSDFLRRNPRRTRIPCGSVRRAPALLSTPTSSSASGYRSIQEYSIV
jgi:hypothetical protein